MATQVKLAPATIAAAQRSTDATRAMLDRAREYESDDGAGARLVMSILRTLEGIDGVGFRHLGSYCADLRDLETLRMRTARKLARLHEAERQARLDLYRAWTDGKVDRCIWCGCAFADLGSVTSVPGGYAHSWWCAFRFTELRAERVEVTAAGKEALADDCGVDWEAEAEDAIARLAASDR